MFAHLKKITLQIVAGANIATIALMLLSGHSDMVSPSAHPLLSVTGLVFPVFLFVNLAFVVFWVLFKPRGVLIPVAGLLLCYGPVRRYAPLNLPGEAPEGAIKVLSYNVHCFGKDNTADCNPMENGIARYLYDSGTDIICLQESACGMKERVDTLMHQRYPYKKISFCSGSSDMLTLYSKYPILKAENIEYGSRTNLSVAYWLDVSGHEVLLVNNHLESNKLTATERAGFKRMVEGDSMRENSNRIIDKLIIAFRKRGPQVDSVDAYVGRNAGNSPVILCGDFNEGPVSYSHYRFRKRLTDCYTSTGLGPGWSFHNSGIRVRIDNIMCSRHFKPYACTVDRSIALSDHYPIYCWLKLQAKP